MKIFLQILAEIAQKEEGINGVTHAVFKKYLFPYHPELGDRLFVYLITTSKATTKHMSQSIFKQQAEKFLSIMNDQTILENYVRMFADQRKENEISPDGLNQLLIVSYRLATSGERGKTCSQLLNTVCAVVTSCVRICLHTQLKNEVRCYITIFATYSFMGKIHYPSVL